MLGSLAIVLLAASSGAQAMDLTVSFGAPGGRLATVTAHDLEAGTPRTIVVDDAGELWAIDVELADDDGQHVTLVGTASLVHTGDIAPPPRPFTVRSARGEAGVARLTGYDTFPRVLSLTVSAPEQTQGATVECEILVAPTVDQFADALQGFVDDGLSVRTGVGPFAHSTGITDAHWVCGW